MSITIDGNGNITASGTEPNITYRYALNVVGAQPIYQQGRGVVTVTPSPNAVLATPAAGVTKWSVAAYNTYSPAGAPTGGTGFQANYSAFLSYPSLLTVPTAVPWSGTTTIGSITGVGISVTYSGSSDHRLKENITPVENGLDYILALRPRRFTWKTTNNQAVGFIAHELQEDLPPELNNMAVGQKDEVNIFVNLYKNGELLLDENGNAIKRLIPKDQEKDLLSLEGITWEIVEEIPEYQTIDSSKLVSPLVSSIQQLKKMTDLQKNKIENLKSRILILEGTI